LWALGSGIKLVLFLVTISALLGFTQVPIAEGAVSWNGFLLQGCLTDSMDHIIGCNY